MSSVSRIVVVGSINVDETLPVSSWPQPGETVLLAGPARSGLGGKGANQAVAAALAGAEVTFVGAVGDDAGADLALDNLRAHRVATDQVRRVAGVNTGRATILVHAEGENLILVDPGANATVSVEHVRSAADEIAAAAVALVQGELSAQVVDAVAAVCRDSGTRFVLNLAPPIDVDEETIAVADPLIVNELEARHLGIDPAEPTLGGPRSLVVTRGGDGVTAVTSEGRIVIPALRVDVADTTGAGDAFAGTVCAALAAGDNLVSACRAGAGAGAFAVTRPGASSSYGDAAQVAALLASAGVG